MMSVFTVQAFVKHISFNEIHPGTKTPETMSAKLTPEKEMANTRLPEYEMAFRQRIGPLLPISRMSTFAMGVVINKIVSEMPAQLSFVNVGVWCGFTYFSGLMHNWDKRCVGIDNFSEFNTDGVAEKAFMMNFKVLKEKSPNAVFYEMDYRNYFETVHQGDIGLYIYDGEHSYENQLEGLKVADRFIADGGYVLVDDSNLQHVKKANADFIAQSENTYDVLAEIDTANNCHPTWWNGMMLMQKTGKKAG